MSIKYAGSDALARMVAKTKKYVEDTVPGIVENMVHDGAVNCSGLSVSQVCSVTASTNSYTYLDYRTGFQEGQCFPIFLGCSPKYADEWNDHPWAMGARIDKNGNNGRWYATVTAVDSSGSDVEGVEMDVFYILVRYDTPLYID